MFERAKLPIDGYIDEIIDALSECQTLVIQAEPGAGKTTRLPAALMGRHKKNVLVLEPRRLAAKLSAQRVAEELGEVCGKQIGYHVRFDRSCSEATRLVYITEGIFLRLLASDPLLSQVGFVVLDEFHERNIYSDLALMLVRQLQKGSRPDLKVLITSATLPTQSLLNYLNNPRSFKVPGRVFPVEIFYQGLARAQISSDSIAKKCLELSQSREHGNILVFLVGIRQILEVFEVLKTKLTERWELIPLTADLSAKEQQRAFVENEKRKLILATNVAETSLTLPNITTVLDPGFAKQSGFATWSGMPTLEIEAISQASATQRAGRAGRTKAGAVFRMYAEADFLKRRPFTLPSIECADLTPYILELLCIMEKSDLPLKLEKWPWYQAPKDKSIEATLRTLRVLKAIDGQNKPTKLGRKISEIALHPRLAAVCLAALETAHAEDIVLAVCVLNEGLPYKYKFKRGSSPCDLSLQTNIVKAFYFEQEHEFEEKFLDQRKLRAIIKLYASLSKQLQLPNFKKASIDSDQLAACLLVGYPDRVAKRRVIKRKGQQKRQPREDLYHFCLGRGGFISERSSIGLPDYVLALEAQEFHGKKASQGTEIQLASSIQLAQLVVDPGAMLRSTTQQIIATDATATGEYYCRFYGDFLVERRKMPKKNALSVEALSAWVQENWPAPFKDVSALELYRSKVGLIQRYGLGDELSDFQGEMFSLFCDAICAEYPSIEALSKLDIGLALKQQLSYAEQSLIDLYAPDHIEMGRGRRFKVDYSSAAGPKISGYIQDFYGLSEPLTIVSGRCNLSLDLLGPDKKPCQTTSDLAGFWHRVYPVLVTRFKRRYPRHYWPDDPASAKPALLLRHLK